MSEKAPSLAERYKGDPRVIITAEGRVVPASCKHCVWHRPPLGAAGDDGWMRFLPYLPPYLLDVETGTYVETEGLSEEKKLRLLRGYKLCTRTGPMTGALFLNADFPALKHGVYDTCGAGNLPPDLSG